MHAANPFTLSLWIQEDGPHSSYPLLYALSLSSLSFPSSPAGPSPVLVLPGPTKDSAFLAHGSDMWLLDRALPSGGSAAPASGPPVDALLALLSPPPSHARPPQRARAAPPLPPSVPAPRPALRLPDGERIVAACPVRSARAPGQVGRVCADLAALLTTRRVSLVDLARPCDALLSWRLPEGAGRPGKIDAVAGGAWATAAGGEGGSVAGCVAACFGEGPSEVVLFPFLATDSGQALAPARGGAASWAGGATGCENGIDGVIWRPRLAVQVAGVGLPQSMGRVGWGGTLDVPRGRRQPEAMLRHLDR